MNGHTTVDPSTLQHGRSALPDLHKVRYRNSDNGRQFSQKLLRGSVLQVVAELFPVGLAHGSSIPEAVATLEDQHAVVMVGDGRRNQIRHMASVVQAASVPIADL